MQLPEIGKINPTPKILRYLIINLKIMKKVFYNIEIGNYTRAGNLQVQYRFVVGCDDSLNQYDVENHFRRQYKGFGISATIVEDIVIATDINKPTKVKAENKLSTIKISQLRHQLNKSDFDQDIRTEWRLLSDKQYSLDSEVDKFKSKLILLIKGRYNNVLSHTKIDEFNIKRDSLKFVADLTGTVIIEEIEKSLTSV